MDTLFKIKDIDRYCYENYLKGYLPNNIIDIHTHVWLSKFKKKVVNPSLRSVQWPHMVAAENSIEEMLLSYELMFPGKKITPLIFSSFGKHDDIEASNNYIVESSEKAQVPALLYTPPWWSGEELENRIISGNYLGIKVYLNLAPDYIPADEIRVYDFLPPHQLEIIDKLGQIVMLHIPRKERFKDRVNLEQVLEIHNKYKNIKVIIAHVGRAYCNSDLGDAFSFLKNADRLLYDFSANTNSYVFKSLIKSVGVKRILFGSDMPITRMRMRRIERDGKYINLVPKGLYGDLSNEKNMEELDGEDAERLTLFMYEELKSFREASIECNLNDNDLEDIFFNNAYKLIKGIQPNRKFRFDSVI